MEVEEGVAKVEEDRWTADTRCYDALFIWW